MEKTLVILKPDAIKRGLTGEIISRYERKGLKIVYCNLTKATGEKLEKHYIEHKGKDFYKKLIEYMSSGNIMVLVLEGENVINQVRKINGKTDPLEADLGSIRGDYVNSSRENLVHSSDSTSSANREIEIWI